MPDGEWVQFDDVSALIDDARRFRWLMFGNGYFLEEAGLRGPEGVREAIDEQMRLESGR